MSSNGKIILHSLGLLVLRVGAGGFLLYGHGWPKITHFAERAASFANPIGVGPTASLALVVFAKVFCALFVILGVATPLASIPIVIFLLVAAFIQGARAPWSDKDLALIYLVPFVTLLFTGGGRFTLDAVIRRGKSGASES